MYGEFLTPEKPANGVYVTPGGKNVIDLTEEGCEMTKSYKIESKCDGTLYLARNK